MTKRHVVIAPMLLAALCLGARADDPAPRTTLSQANVPFRVPDRPYVVLRRGDLEAVIVDNRAVDDDVLPGHRAGYSGLAALRHAQRRENLFVPAYAGLNFEHIHDGTHQESRVLFEPRHAPMELRVIDARTAELYQPPSPHFGLESCQRFTLTDDGAIELAIECIPRRKTFAHGYIGLFWASYIHRPKSLDIHFLGWPEEAVAGRAAQDRPPPTWQRGVTPRHGESAGHWSADDHRRFAHEPKFADALKLVFSRSQQRYAEPWYFGISDEMAFVQVFRPQDKVRLAQSPSGGGTGNPAWDFQFLISDYEVDRRYQFIMRALYVPETSPDRLAKLAAFHGQAMGAER
jgi:hypothetical protein